MAWDISITRAEKLKEKPDQDNLGFGQIATDHMFVMDYDRENGWHNPRIIPYAPLELNPATMIMHYGQGVFEGLKAYKAKDGRILLFRPEKNIHRLNQSNERMCIPLLDEGFVLYALKTLVALEQDWIPTAEGTSLYIRPFIIATDPFLGVRPSDTYKFIIILSPVGAYYPEGINPVKIYVETEYVRTVKGGVGYVKTIGNYAASLKAQMEAKKKGYSQVLWLDAIERKYVEEVGTSNVFFVIDGEVVTPALTGSILPGVTRDSAIALIKKWGMKIAERQISIDEVFRAHSEGKLDEAFATGTAAVISPIGELCWNNRTITINNFMIGRLSQKLYDTITGIQNGTVKDDLGWTVTV